MYEESLAKKVPNSRAAQEAENKEKVIHVAYSLKKSMRGKY